MSIMNCRTCGIGFDSDEDAEHEEECADDVAENDEAIGTADYNLHLDAGLCYSGVSNGETQWLGTKEQWDKYEQLKNTHE